MTFMTRLLSWFRNVLHRSRSERDMDTELHFHVEARAADLARSGVPREEALRRARLEFGGIEQAKEQCRDAHGLSLLESLSQDLRFGLRMLQKSPGFTVIAVLTLALGIGATTAIFSVVDAVLLKPLPIEDPSRVVLVQEQWQDIFPGLSVGNFVDLLAQSTSFTNLCASNNASFNLLTQDVPEHIQGEIVTASYFPTFGVQPIAGRTFAAGEDTPGHAQLAIISERLWRSQFHADQAAIGQTLHINGLSYILIGVMPKTFDPLLQNSDIWIPAAYSPQQRTDHDNHYLSVIGRLKPGISSAAAQSELHIIAGRLQQQYPNEDQGRELRLMALSTALLGDQQLSLRLLLASVLFLLLIACANIANLQLARARSRQKEIAVRAALGATAKRIVGQLLIENVILGLAGGLVGVFLAYWAVSWIVAKGPAGVPRLDQSAVDTSALAFATAVALFSSFLFGLAPAMRSASVSLSEAFKSDSRTSSGGRDRVRSALVVCEIALALMLMAGAGLLIRSALLVSHLDPGFDTANLVVGRVGLPDSSYREPAVARQTFERMIQAAAALPEVESAAIVSRAPLAEGGSTNGLIPEGKSLEMSNAVNASIQVVSVGYLTTARVPLKLGRDFTEQDTRDKILVTIVNETLARSLWPGGNPIGKRFACCEAGPKGGMDPVWHEVVGVVGDVRAGGLDRQVPPQFYLPLAQMPPSAWDWLGRTMDLVVRTRTPTFPANDLRAAVASVAPGVPVYQLSTMQEKIAGRLEQSRFDTFLLSPFSAVALMLASVGIYGVLSYIVAQRTRDIGLRMALGATQGRIAREVLGYALGLTGIGLAIGIVCGLLCSQLLSSLLYGVRSTDVVAFAGASFLLACVALLASYIPSRRASRVDPIIALRYE
jgi:putative ABC transport system permease protein